jgi:citrate lyase gamma subunit
MDSTDKSRTSGMILRKILFPGICGIAGVFLLLLTGSGCRRIQGTVLENEPRSVAIPIVVNKTYEYGVEERITDILVQEFIRDGRLRVTDRSSADLVLSATVDEYKLRTVNVNERDQAVVFRLNTRIVASLYDSRAGKWIYQNERFDESGVFFLANQPQSRREEQVYVRLSEDIISRFLEGW